MPLGASFFFIFFLGCLLIGLNVPEMEGIYATGGILFFFLGCLVTGLNVHSNLSRLIGDGGSGGTGTYVLPPTRYTVTTTMTLH